MRDTSKPKLRTHKGTGQAYVILGGKRKYLGRADAPDVKEKYTRAMAEWNASSRPATAAPEGFTVGELVLAFLGHAEAYYRGPDGEPTKSLHGYKAVLRPLRELYGRTPVADFGPNRLRAVRQAFIDKGWCRQNVNKSVGLVRTVMRWGVGQELVDPSVVTRLEAVEALQRGRTTAREAEPVRPVVASIVAKTKPYMSRTVRAMVELQELTGMRPGEVCAMRACDIDADGKVWVFRPEHHKTSYRGRNREVFIGPKAQRVLTPFLRADTTAYLFSPAESAAEHRQRRTESRETPLSCGNTVGSNVKRTPRRKPGERFCTASYGQAVEHACRAAFPIPGGADAETVRQWKRDHWWRPHRLRHTFATSVRRKYGLEASQVLLGHASADVTQVYAERDRERGIAVAMKIG